MHYYEFLFFYRLQRFIGYNFPKIVWLPIGAFYFKMRIFQRSFKGLQGEE